MKGKEGPELEITSLVHGGEGLGRLRGKVIFVPYTLPGERVRVTVEEERRRYSRGRVVEVLTPSPHRVEPPCPYFGRCGGCQWQHIAYPEQLHWKREILRQQLKRIGGISDAPVVPVAGMEEPWRYRNSVGFAVDPQGRLGLKAWRSKNIVPLQTCLILNSLLLDLFHSLEIELPELKRVTLRGSPRTGESVVVLETSYDEPPFLEVTLPCSCVLELSNGARATLVGNDFITEELAGQRFRISAGSFFQVNTLQAERLAQLLLECLEPRGDEVVLDAYCGVGTFGLILAPRVARVIGIEAEPEALADARHNAEGVENIEFFAGTVEEVLPRLNQHFTIALLDPPRQGCSPQALTALLHLAPPTIAYISCDPATLARDLKTLTSAGYHLEVVQPLDMFPQTYHIESLTILRQSGA